MWLIAVISLMKRLNNIRDLIAKMDADYRKPVLAVHGGTNAYCFNQPETSFGI